jgi:hypothetical protein
LNNKLGGRIYPSELALTKDPVFPCVNFDITEDISPANIVSDKVRFATLRIWVWSQESHDDTRDIYDPIKQLFNNQRRVKNGTSMVYAEVSGPAEISDKEANVYGVMTLWDLKVIGG